MLGVRLYAALSPRSRHVRLTLRVKCRFSLRSYGYGVRFGTNGKVTFDFDPLSLRR